MIEQLTYIRRQMEQRGITVDYESQYDFTLTGEEGGERQMDFQNQYLFLPDQHSDFPFAVFAEDWGFAGCLLLICIYGFLVLWSVRIASTAKDRFGAVLAIGVGALIFWHAIFNLGMVTGLLPVVGVTLPLFSAGGSSLLTILTGIGLLMNVSMRRYTPAGSARLVS